MSACYHEDRLRAVFERFATAISDQSAVLKNLTDLAALWDSFKSKALNAAQSIGEYLRSRQNFVLLETLEAIAVAWLN